MSIRPPYQRGPVKGFTQVDQNTPAARTLAQLIKSSPGRFQGTQAYLEMLNLLRQQQEQAQPQSKASLLMGF